MCVVVLKANELDEPPIMLTAGCFQISPSVHDDVETVS